MTNEISIVVRVQNAASRGFGQIGQAATGMNSAIEAAGNALDAIDSIQQSGADKAAHRAQTQNDVKQAMIDSEQAANDLKQATIDANQAQLDATAAQDDYNTAVKKFGANSEEAKQAQADLTQAQADSTQATTDMKQAQVDATQAQIDLNAAQRELNPSFVQGITAKFQELAPILGIAALGAQSVTSMLQGTRVATIAASAATKAYAVVQAGLNVVMRMNPIGLVITAIALLVAGVILAYQKSETFRTVMRAVFKAVGNAALDFVDGFLAGLEALLNGLGQLPGPLGAPFRKGAEKVRELRNGVKALKEDLNRLPSKKDVNIRVNTTYAVYGNKGGSYQGGTFVKNKATGGVTGAATGGGRSGWTMTGESGRELLQLPPGTQVRSNPDTRRIMAGSDSGGNGGRVDIYLHGDGIMKGLRYTIREQGGDVQKVLGP